MKNSVREQKLGWISRIRELVFGVQDGVISTVGFLSGMQGAVDNRSVIVIAGLAQVLTGAFSMSIGAFLSTKAEKEAMEGILKTEEEQTKQEPYVAQEELLRAFEKDGLTREEGYRIVSILGRSRTAFREVFHSKILGIASLESSNPLQAAAVMYLSFVIGGIFPMAPYLFWRGAASLPLSVFLSCVALFATGWIKGMIVKKAPARSALEFFLIALLSALVGYAVGVVLNLPALSF